jgi:hypothetical protein
MPRSRIATSQQIDNEQSVNDVPGANGTAADDHRPIDATDELLAAPDPFDPEFLRIDVEGMDAVSAEKKLITVPVRKPGRAEFVRVHPDAAYELSTSMIDLKDEREIYLLHPHVRSALAAETTVSVKLLYTAISRQGVLFLWPVRLPGPDGRHDEWSRSAMAAAVMAKGAWVRVQANMALGAYEVYEARGDLPEPKWPDLSLTEILKIAFKDRHITDLDHPILRRLRGDV